MKLRDRLNNKTKGEQLFILSIMFVALLGVFCVTGCGGGKSCEKPKCGSGKYMGASAVGCSIPGCGGCLSSGSGCNSACWPQSCKLTSVAENEKDEITGERTVAKIFACDVRYYGDGCLGCGQYEKSCYNGCIKIIDDDTKINGFFYGSSEKEEKIIGCINGCGGCFGSDGIGEEMIKDLEDKTGVE